MEERAERGEEADDSSIINCVVSPLYAAVNKWFAALSGLLNYSAADKVRATLHDKQISMFL